MSHPGPFFPDTFESLWICNTMTQELDIIVWNRSKLSLVHLSQVHLISKNSTQLSSHGTCSSPLTQFQIVTSEIIELLGQECNNIWSHVDATLICYHHCTWLSHIPYPHLGCGRLRNDTQISEMGDFSKMKQKNDTVFKNSQEWECRTAPLLSSATLNKPSMRSVSNLWRADDKPSLSQRREA